MATACTEQKPTLHFWGEEERVIPLISRSAARVLPTTALSTDAERFFKVTKAVCSDHRSCLLPDTVNMCSSMHLWLTERYGYTDAKSSTREKKSVRFASLNANLEVESPTAIDSDSEGDSDSGSEDEE